MKCSLFSLKPNQSEFWNSFEVPRLYLQCDSSNLANRVTVLILMSAPWIPMKILLSLNK